MKKGMVITIAIVIVIIICVYSFNCGREEARAYKQSVSGRAVLK